MTIDASFSPDGYSGVSLRHRLPGVATTFVALMIALAPPVLAGAVTVTCANADMIVSTWKGPMSLAYTGDANGSLNLKAPYGELTMPAMMKTQGGTTLIEAFGNTTITMPDLTALEACIAKTIEPGQEGDADGYATARDACLPGTPAGAAPIPVTAWVKLGVFPGEPPEKYGLVIEIKRTYLETTKAPGGKTSIDSFPARCELSAQ